MAPSYLLLALAMRVVFADKAFSHAFEFHQNAMIEDKV
jgi:hypothetical protein